MGEHASDTLQLLDDGKRLIQQFFPVLSKASSHTYYTALAFTPLETSIRKKYSFELKDSVKVCWGLEKQWESCLYTMECHGSEIYSIAVSPDGTHIASGSKHGTLCLWDFTTGAHLQCLGKQEHVLSAMFSPTGAYIIGASGIVIQLWDVASGAHISTFEGHRSVIECTVFSPDGAHIASGSCDCTIQIWKATGVHLRTLEGHADWVTCVAYSPSGAHLVSSSVDGIIRIWEAETGMCLRTFKGHLIDISPPIAYSPDGTHIVSGSIDGTIHIWIAATGVCLRMLKANSTRVVSVAYSPDGAYIVSGYDDSSIQILGANGILLKTLKGHSDLVRSVVYSHDGTKIVSGSLDQTIRIWDAEIGTQHDVENGIQHPKTLKDHIKEALGCRASPHLPPGCFPTRMYSLLQQNAIITLNSSCIAIFSHGGSIELWNLSDRSTSKVANPSSDVCQMQFSYNNIYLVVVLVDGTMQFYSGLTGVHLKTYKDSVTFAAFSVNDSYLALGSFDNSVQVWESNPDLEFNKPYQTLRGHSDVVQAITFSHDGIYIVSGSRDKTVQMWSMITGVQLACFKHDCLKIEGMCMAWDQKSIILSKHKPFTPIIYDSHKDSVLTIPMELWPTPVCGPQWFDDSMVETEGWMYSETLTGKKRVCWIPVSLRCPKRWGLAAGLISHQENGCLLRMCRSFDQEQFLVISQS